MKTATLPPLRVEPELRRAAERLLRPGESLSSFVEQAVREGVERRRQDEAFLARGLASAESARKTNTWFTPAEVLAKIDRRVGQVLRATRKPRRHR